MSAKPLARLVRKALEEDVGLGDLTTNLTVPDDARCTATLVAKAAGVLSGIGAFRAVFDRLKTKVKGWDAMADGTAFRAGDSIARFTGGTRAVLTGERTAMNFVQHLSGVATLTAEFVAAVKGLDATICDTRKTTPLLRDSEKAAVLHGGGSNHRHALYDGMLIKENHIAAAGGITEAIEKVSQGAHHLMKIEVEVRSLDELEEALKAGADVIMLDNMGLDTMAAAVDVAGGSSVLLEASGNISLDTVRAVAETGVHIISVGALTHSAPSAD
ncbi:MAG: carboxylating nicotinate-nucleotide diphosphorylase, partial [Nitrospiraceae bacterium]|nr:carboxylating nicotinate-nucleotide diphosphorylase [Nitrospiraceae bacterium]